MTTGSGSNRTRAVYLPPGLSVGTPPGGPRASAGHAADVSAAERAGAAAAADGAALARGQRRTVEDLSWDLGRRLHDAYT